MLFWTASLAPAILPALAWVWCFVAWRMLPDVARGTSAEQGSALYWASEVPLAIFGGLIVLLAVGFSAYAFQRGRAWLIPALCIYYGVATVLVAVASFMFIPFKPPDW